jgi:hypothetical protein
VNQEEQELLEAAKELAKYTGSNISTDSKNGKEKYTNRKQAFDRLAALVSKMNKPTVTAEPETKKEESNVNPLTPFMQSSLEKSIDIYTTMAQNMGVGKRQQMTIKQAVKDWGFQEGALSRRLALYEHLGLLKMELEWEWQKTHSYWTVLKPVYEAKGLIEDFYASGKSIESVQNRGALGRDGTRKPRKNSKAAPVEVIKPAEAPTPERYLAENNTNTTPNPEPAPFVEDRTPDELVEVGKPGDLVTEAYVPPLKERVAVRMNGETPVEAIAGPDAPSPFESLRAIRKDDVQALIEAAKQYANRKDAVRQSFANLEKLGIKIDMDKAMSAVEFSENPYLEGVSILLPYLSTLEAQINQSNTWKVEVSTLRREKGQLQDLFNREKEANKRLSERMAQMTASRQ